MQYDVILLNYGKVSIDNKPFTKIEYCFAKREQYVQSDRLTGVVPIQTFIPKDITNMLKPDFIYNQFTLDGELIPDIKKPLNKKFKLNKMINVTTKNVINISE